MVATPATGGAVTKREPDLVLAVMILIFGLSTLVLALQGGIVPGDLGEDEDDDEVEEG